ncbi:MAG: ankyrin repeat domain-containing protein [Alphaproteobacteria bacterium]
MADEKIHLSLNDAAMKGDIEAAKAAISLGADVHHNFDMALRSAAKASHLPMIDFLVTEQGANVHALNDDALRAAAKNGRAAVAEKLLGLGANPDAQDGDPLIQSATKGYAEIAKSLLAHKADPHIGDDQALRQAAYNGHLDIVEALARNKADLFALRGSAAELAASEKKSLVVEFLAIEMNRQREMFLAELSGASTRNFLRATWHDTGEPAFIRAVKMNCLPQAVARMKETSDSLNPSDLTDLKDRKGRCLGVLAAEYGALTKLFDPALWHGTLDDVQQAWNKIPPGVRKTSGMTDADFEGVVASFNQRTLKERGGKVKIKF